MANIQSLPIEIVDLIFNHEAQRVAVEFNPDHTTCTPHCALFPLNVALTCKLWFDIIKSSPGFWQSVVIDVANDITPFLDLNVFELFEVDLDDKDSGLDVVVFSSSRENGGPDITVGEGEDTQKVDENSRVLSVFQQLEPRLARCRSIRFDLIYQSSLPSAGAILAQDLPMLVEFSQSCLVHDFDSRDEIQFPMDDTEELLPSVAPKIPRLTHLSLTGYGFMEINQAAIYCEESNFFLSVTGSIKLSIDHFKFDRYGPSGFVDDINSRSFATFLHGLEEIRSKISHVSLSDMSLDYRPSKRLVPTFDLRFDVLSFDAVSSDFLSAFFAVVDFRGMGGVRTMTFSNCYIPFMGQDLGLSNNGNFTLQLLDIPGTASNSSLDDSIYNALTSLPAQHVRLLRCDGITDEFFDWLGGDGREGEVEVNVLETLVMRDCSGFTSRGVKSLLEDRDPHFRAEHWPNKYISMLRRLEVVGSGPLLPKADVAFFQAQHPCRVVWNVENADQDADEEHISNLHA